MKLIPCRRTWRALFIVYATALFIATHWPALEIPAGEIPRPDLFIHVVVFGGWTFLLCMTGWTGRGLRGAAIAVAVGVLYAAIDEGLQGIPALRRTLAFDDWLANVLGVVAGGGAGWLFNIMFSRTTSPAAPASDTNA